VMACYFLSASSLDLSGHEKDGEIPVLGQVSGRVTSASFLCAVSYPLSSNPFWPTDWRVAPACD
jgi:hypothetical protein